MMNEKQVSTEEVCAEVQDILHTVSGAYCSEFWDCMYEVSGSLDTIKAIKKSIETLHAAKQDTEAFQLIIALYNLIALEVPEAIREVEPYEAAATIFVDEFIEDSIDLLYDYEAEKESNSVWN